MNSGTVNNAVDGTLGNKNLFVYASVTSTNGRGNVFETINYSTCISASKFEIMATAGDFNTKFYVPLYYQGRTYLCWAYCDQMILDYKRSVRLTREQATAAIKEREGDINKGQHPRMCMGYKEHVDVKDVTSINVISELIKDGPIIALYRKTYYPDQSHVVVVTHVDLKRGLVHTNNPHGILGVQTFDEFLNGFTGSSDENYPFVYFCMVKY